MTIGFGCCKIRMSRRVLKYFLRGVCMNNVFNYTQMLNSIRENLPESANFVPRTSCASVYNELKSKYEALSKTNPSYVSLFDLNAELLDILGMVSAEVRQRRKNEPAFFTVNDRYMQVLDYYKRIIDKLPLSADINKIFFSEIKSKMSLYKSPVSYMSRLVLTRLKKINKELLGDFEENWNDNAPAENKIKVIELLIMRQFIFCFGDGTLRIPLENGKGYSSSLKKLQLSDKGKKKKIAKEEDEQRIATANDYSCPEIKEQRIATADDYYCPKIKEMCEKNYRGSYEEMAKGLTFLEFSELKADRECRLATLASQLASLNFGVQKRNRANLYVFAIAFQLTFNEPGCEDTDINKCLFYDLNNTTFLDLAPGADENSLTDYGINYKNYVDIIYLYYISRETDKTGAAMTPALRLYRILNTMAYIKRLSKKSNVGAEQSCEYPKKANGLLLSDDYKAFVLGDMLKLGEKQFRDMLFSKIYINSTKDDERGWTSTHLYSSEQLTANIFYRFFNENAVDIKPMKFVAKYPSDGSKKSADDPSVTAERTDYYDFGDIPFDPEKVNRPDVAAYRKRIRKIINILSNPDYRPEKKQNKDNLIIARAELFSAYCRHLVCCFRRAAANSSTKHTYAQHLRSFSQFYDYFCSTFVVKLDPTGKKETIAGANDVLIRSNFSAVSCSCMFDIVAIFITYHACIYEIYGEEKNTR